MSVKKYLTLNGLTYFLNKIKTYLTSSTYLNSIGISNSDIDDIADDAGYSSGSLPASEDIFITGDIIPNTDNSVDLGASSKNIKMIYTKGITIDGTQFLPSDYVNLTSGQTISGRKTFTDRLTYKATSTIAGDGTSGNFAGSFNFTDKNNVQIGMFGLSVFNNNGYTEQVLNIINPLWFNDNTKTKSFAVRLRVMHDTGEASFTPTGNAINLGGTAQKWKTFNGLNPGALSLPSTSYTTLDVTNFVLDGDTNNRIVMPYDSWLNIRMTSCENYSVRNTLNGITYQVENANGLVHLTIPVPSGTNMAIYAKCSSIDLRAFACQGNV